MGDGPDRERTRLLAVLTGLLFTGAGVMVAQRGHALIPVIAIVAIVVAVGGFIALLRYRPKDLGFEGRFVDLWSISHFMAGVLPGLVDLGVLWVLVIALLWEVIELVCRVTEHTPNRVIDVLLALLGWTLVNAAAGGSMAFW